MGAGSAVQPDHWDATLKLYCFEKISSDELDAAVRERAAKVIEFVANELSISPPRVVWIKPASPVAAAGALRHNFVDETHPRFARIRVDILGGYTPEHLDNQIWIRNNVSRVPNLEFVAAHETRHVWQKATYAYIFGDECRAEGDAHPYAFDVLKRLVNQGFLSRELETEIDTTMESKRCEFLTRWPDGCFEILKT